MISAVAARWSRQRRHWWR